MKKKTIYFAFLALFFLAVVFLAFNRHSKYGPYHYRSEIFADRAGYYIYLPALFIYHFQPEKLPKDADRKTGNGFRLDLANNKIITKYPYGVALLQTPFFLMAHILSILTGQKADGFTFLYQKSVDVASVFFLILGLFALFRIFRKQYSLKISFITLGTVFLGTNLFYYSIMDTGMSHVYSFSMFSLYLLFLSDWEKMPGQQIKQGILLGLVAAVILILRPINLLFILFTFFLYPDIFREKLRSRKIWFIVAFFLTGFVVILPQMIYWHYLSGSFIHYSYGNETFTHLADPQLAALFFAPNNGHLLYNPVFLVFVTGVVLMIFDKKREGLVTGLLLLVLSYLISAWWMYYFGCGFANRNFTEYYAVLALPLAYLINKPKRKSLQSVLYFLLLVFSIYNIKMALSFDGCWYGTGNWDWNMYLHWLLNPPS